MVTGYIPDIGDVVWMTLDPTKGHEQEGRRTFLVLTPKRYNDKTSLVVGCPITNKSKGYPFELPVSGTAAVTGVVLADQVKSLDWRMRHADFIASVDAVAVAKVRVYVKRLLNI